MLSQSANVMGKRAEEINVAKTMVSLSEHLGNSCELPVPADEEVIDYDSCIRTTVADSPESEKTTSSHCEKPMCVTEGTQVRS